MRPCPTAGFGGLALALVGMLVPLVAAGSAPPEPSGGLPTLAELDALAPDSACPLDLVAALDAVGSSPTDLEIGVDIAHGRELPPLSTIPVDDLTGLDLAGGTVVVCDARVEGARVSAMLHASLNEGATIGTFVARMAGPGGLAVEDIQKVINRISFTPEGELVDVSDLSDRIAIARPVIEGAADATLVVLLDPDDDSESSGELDGGSVPDAPSVDVVAVAAELVGVAPRMSEDAFVEAATQHGGLDAGEARCIYAALDGDVRGVLGSAALDLAADDLQRLSAALAECETAVATTS